MMDKVDRSRISFAYREGGVSRLETNTRNASSVAAGSGSRTTLKKNPISRGVVDVEAATGSVPFRLHARTSSQAVLFRTTRGIALREAESAPFPAGITNLVTRRPPLPVTLHGRMLSLRPFPPPKKEGLILVEKGIVAREREREKISNFPDNRRISR